MQNAVDKTCTENHNTHFIFNYIFPKIVPFMRQCGKYGGAREATDDVKQRMRFACCITKATETHSKYVILTAFPRKQ